MITYGFHADHVVFQIILNVLVVLSVTFITAACSRRRQCVTHCRRLLQRQWDSRRVYVCVFVQLLSVH